MSEIQCFMLSFTGERRTKMHPTGKSSTPIYSDVLGNLYHLGHLAVATFDDGSSVPAAPAGAIWDCDWMHGLRMGDVELSRNADGLVLCVRTPHGDWLIDGPSKDGGQWSRTGDAPNITVTPSISQPTYHGWLREGKLVECQ